MGRHHSTSPAWLYGASTSTGHRSPSQYQACLAVRPLDKYWPWVAIPVPALLGCTAPQQVLAVGRHPSTSPAWLYGASTSTGRGSPSQYQPCLVVWSLDKYWPWVAIPVPALLGCTEPRQVLAVGRHPSTSPAWLYGASTSTGRGSPSQYQPCLVVRSLDKYWPWVAIPVPALLGCTEPRQVLAVGRHPSTSPWLYGALTSTGHGSPSQYQPCLAVRSLDKYSPWVAITVPGLLGRTEPRQVLAVGRHPSTSPAWLYGASTSTGRGSPSQYQPCLAVRPLDKYWPWVAITVPALLGCTEPRQVLAMGRHHSTRPAWLYGPSTSTGRGSPSQYQPCLAVRSLNKYWPWVAIPVLALLGCTEPRQVLAMGRHPSTSPAWLYGASTSTGRGSPSQYQPCLAVRSLDKYWPWVAIPVPALGCTEP